MPTVLNGMYFKGQIDYFGKILQNLAFLRPELVIPPVMERLFVAFDTLTEPHKLTSSMSSVFSMARSVVDPAAGYKEPPTQVSKYTIIFYVYAFGLCLHLHIASILISCQIWT